MDNLNDSDITSSLAKLGLIRMVWVVCQDRWIDFGLVESAWRTDDEIAQYLFRCPLCDLEHMSAIIWNRNENKPNLEEA